MKINDDIRMFIGILGLVIASVFSIVMYLLEKTEKTSDLLNNILSGVIVIGVLMLAYGAITYGKDSEK